MEKGALTDSISSTNRSTFFLFLFISLPLLLLAAVANHRNSTTTLFPTWTFLTRKPLNQASLHPPTNTGTGSRSQSLNDTVSTLGGLLPSTFDEKTCLSRYQAHLYLKPSPHTPSPLLITKLRSYERLHERCGPNSTTFKRTLQTLSENQGLSNSADCNYIVWIPANGLGNRMVSLVATFLYAMFTDRVLLVAFDKEMSDVFCEPFPNSTWMLPHDFPHRNEFYQLPTYQGMLKNKTAREVPVPPFVFIDLKHGDDEHERFFHCNEGQASISRVPVLFLMSDQYFVPSLFMTESFQDELPAMFPEKDTVFHHLGRYLFSPTNDGWKLITRFYEENFSRADHKVGIQVRVFTADVTPAETIMDQILACTMNNNVLPKIDNGSKVFSWPDSYKNVTSMAVLVTSLYNDYSENLTAMYSTRSTSSGGRVRVSQPSHEEKQKSYDNTHNVKALMEMYLLSLCDVLVTSGESTFGYVAQSLGGVKPWIMYKTVGKEFRKPPCEEAISMEPCFHFPPMYDCKRRVKVGHMSSVFPYMKKCEDHRLGVKMIG